MKIPPLKRYRLFVRESGLRSYGLLIGIVVGVLLGILFGTYFPESAVHTKILGDLFLNALTMMVLPIIVTSMVIGVTNLGDVRHLGSLGLKTLFYYMTTTGFAVAIGISAVLWIRPGEGMGRFTGTIPEKIVGKEDLSFLDVIIDLIHPNLVQAAVEMKILPIIIASLLFGVAVTTLGERGRVLVQFFSALNDTVMKVVHWILFFAPFGIFGLIAYRLGVAGGGDAVTALILQLGKYVATVTFGLAIHGILFLPLLLFLLSGWNPWRYLLQLGKALLTAFATASSSATLPLTMECVTDEANVSKQVSSFVLPLGATINMDGTALYEAVAAIFIAQSYGITLGPEQLLILFLTATLAAIGAAGIPEAGLVTMVLVLQAVGLPIEGIGLILAIDWLLDRFRTTVNVWGDAVGAAVIDHTEKKRGSVRQY
jgi:Na+/H+-dicarboxylate symporter